MHARLNKVEKGHGEKAKANNKMRNHQGPLLSPNMQFLSNPASQEYSAQVVGRQKEAFHLRQELEAPFIQIREEEGGVEVLLQSCAKAYIVELLERLLLLFKQDVVLGEHRPLQFRDSVIGLRV